MVCMPGREQRFNEAPFPTIDEAIEAIAHAVPSPCDNLVVFGHSLGGLIGFGVVSVLERRLQRPLGALFIAGKVAPSAARCLNLHIASDAELSAAVEELGGTPPEIIRDHAAWAHYSHFLRADFKLAQDWSADRLEFVSTSMTVLSGMSDLTTSAEGLRAWRRCALGPFEMRTLPGGHFFPFENSETILKLLRERSPGVNQC